MAGEAAEDVKRLDQSRRQFFQWCYHERLPLSVVQDKMDKLTDDPASATGDKFKGLYVYLQSNFSLIHSYECF